MEVAVVTSLGILPFSLATLCGVVFGAVLSIPMTVVRNSREDSRSLYSSHRRANRRRHSYRTCSQRESKVSSKSCKSTSVSSCGSGASCSGRAIVKQSSRSTAEKLNQSAKAMAISM